MIAGRNVGVGRPPDIGAGYGNRTHLISLEGWVLALSNPARIGAQAQNRTALSGLQSRCITTMLYGRKRSLLDALFLARNVGVMA